MATIKWVPGTRGRDRAGNEVVVVRASEVKGVIGKVYRYWVTTPDYESPLRLIDVGGFTADPDQPIPFTPKKEQLTEVLPGYEEIVKKQDRWARS